MFNAVISQLNLPELESQKLKFWEGDSIFHKSVENRKGSARFVFYEGPPTANGKPGIHHVLGRAFKDLILRYKTMKGFLVERRGGWDTHGLPVEIEVEKKLGLKGKPDILKLKDNEYDSIEFFNQQCRESVFTYVDEWVNLTNRVGLWLDMENAYVTYDNNYIESVWWFIKQVNEKGLLYKDYKVVPYCPRCGTSLSSHELAQGYKDDVEDPSVFIKFELVGEPDTFVLVWTTTPWTLPGNVALAMGRGIDYVKVEQKGEKYILAKSRLEVLDGEYKILENVKIDDLLGKSYKPLYPYLNPDKRAYFIAEAPFASSEEGTGIVHTAVMYGVEDFELGKKLDLPMKHLVNLRGEFVPEVEKFAGRFVKSADKEVIADLQERNILYKVGTIKHTYPFCWRCGTPILYYALDAWFIKTTAVRDQLLSDNEKINWVPKTIREGRMKNWLETLIDWNITRNRFWGTPLPIWVCENHHYQIIGGREEIEKLGGEVPSDLHRPFIDQVVLNCPECTKKMHRLPDVMDVWMDSGAMPFAQWHYPFENQEIYKEWYPADYIVEAIDQTRGWFFTLMAEAMLLGNDAPAPFKNVVVTGHLLDENGLKMSKSKGNILNPWELIDAVGADTVRWYMYTASLPGTSFSISKELVSEKYRKFILILWNSYKFFVDYASVYHWSCDLKTGELTVMDKWVLAKLTQLVLDVNKNLDKYNITQAARSIEDFVVNDFSTWYIRRIRDRVGPESSETERNTALSVLYGNLVTLSKLMSPFIPFVTEEMYQNLTDESSVHLADYPLGDKSLLNDQLVEDMKLVRQIVEIGHSKRKEAGIKLRQPLAKVTYQSSKKLGSDLERIVMDELNVKNIEHFDGKNDELVVELDTKITTELAKEGEARDLIRQIQSLRKENNLTLQDKIEVKAPDWPKEFEEMILKSTASVKISQAESLQIAKV